jgi:hypothetical protein
VCNFFKDDLFLIPRIYNNLVIANQAAMQPGGAVKKPLTTNEVVTATKGLKETK